MSSLRALCCLPSVKKQKHDFHFFRFNTCVIKQLLHSVFVSDIQNNQSLSNGYQPLEPSASADNSY